MSRDLQHMADAFWHALWTDNPRYPWDALLYASAVLDRPGSMARSERVIWLTRFSLAMDKIIAADRERAYYAAVDEGYGAAVETLAASDTRSRALGKFYKGSLA